MSIMIETLLDAREDLCVLPRVCGQALVDLGPNPLLQHRAHPRHLLSHRASRSRRRLHCLAEDASRIIRPCSPQLLLETMHSTYLTNEGEIAAEVTAEELRDLATHTGCMVTRKEHDDLYDSAGARHGRASLASAFKFEVGPI